jgi:hypothetical protein
MFPVSFSLFELGKWLFGLSGVFAMYLGMGAVTGYFSTTSMWRTFYDDNFHLQAQPQTL